jgi:hypothetical protein
MAEKKTKKGGLTANEKQFALQVLSALSFRAEVASRLGISFGGKRDLYDALGYKSDSELKFEDYMAKYERQDIAKAVIDKPVKACWRKPPEIVESEDKTTPFEKAWADLVKQRKIWHYLSQVDRLAAIGEFAVLLMGFDDTEGLENEVKGNPKLIYLAPYSQGDVTISRYETDVRNERYGQPVLYSVKMRTAESLESGTNKNVHWSRIIHVAEDCAGNDFIGTPQLKSIYNRLDNLELIAGGSAEGFWQMAFPGLNFAMDPNVQMIQNEDALKDEIEKMVHGFKRHIRTKGIKIEPIVLQVADPANHVDAQVTLIACAKGIPKRILLGSERGELASSQDETAWRDLIDERRKQHCEPRILRPFIDRLTSFKVLPEPKQEYNCKWPDLMLPSEKERAEVGEIKSRTLANYSNAIGADSVVPPEIFLTDIMGMNKEKLKQINDILEGILKDE